MQNAVRHRGPDDEGLWIDEKNGVHLAHTRLAIIDPLDAVARAIAQAAPPARRAEHARPIDALGER